MRILQINCVYAIGSTGKIVEDISKFCVSNGDKVLILYGRQGKNITSNVVKVSSEVEAKIHSVISKLIGLDFAYSPIATQKTIKIIKCFRPDVVHLHCLNGHFVNVYKLVEMLKQEQIPTVLTLHAEIMHTAGCEHAYECMKWVEGCHDCNRIRGKFTHFFRDDAKYAYKKMQRAFEGFKNLTVVSVSSWLMNRAKQSAIFANCGAKFVTIENGLDLDAFHPISLQDNPLFRRYNTSKPIVLHVTPNFQHPLKGGKYVLELAKIHRDWTFVIVGYNGNGELPSNVKAISHTQNKEELSWYYNIASLTLLTSKRETFSMVCAESLACGTPVVGFEAGGPESVFIGNFVKFVEYGNVMELSNAMNEMIICNPRVDADLIRKKFAAEEMTNKYCTVYKELSKMKVENK